MLRHADLGLLIGASGLSVLGILLVWSATQAEAGASLALKQAVSLVAGMASAWVLARLDRHTIRALAPFMYGAAVLGLAAVVGPLGSTVNGSRSWIRLPGGFSLQPSELAKVGLAVVLAMIVADRADRGMAPRHRDVLVAWLLAGLAVGLIMRQPDLGSAMVLVAMTVAAVAATGTPKVWTVAAVVGGIGAVVLAFTTNVLSGYQRNRLLAFLHPDLDPEGIGYQARQVRIAISGGGLWGQGLFHGTQTQAGHVPFQETDFVFSVAGEELGFAGSVGLIVLVGFMVARMLLVAKGADAFGRTVCIAVATWFAVQSAENIGMNLGVTPVTGVPLPFLSYGGSSMIAAWLAVGLVARISRDRSRA